MLRIILVLPILFILSAAGLTWTLLYDKNLGLINHFLELIGIPSRIWLYTAKTAFPAVIITDIWAWTPFMYLILLGGLQSLPSEALEAAEIDGASSLQRL